MDIETGTELHGVRITCVPVSKESSLSQVVDLDVLEFAGFNELQSLKVIIGLGKFTNVFISTKTPLKIVICNIVRKQRDGNHTEWHLGTFQKDDGENRSDESIVIANIAKVYRREFRVRASALERMIRRVMLTPMMGGLEYKPDVLSLD